MTGCGSLDISSSVSAIWGAAANDSYQQAWKEGRMSSSQRAEVEEAHREGSSAAAD